MKMEVYRLISVISKTMLAGLALLVLVPAMVLAKSENAGLNQPNPNQPFVTTSIATFKYPWAIAFLPDSRLLVTEKPGKLFIVTQKGLKTEVTGITKVYYHGQNGMLDVAVSPAFVRDHSIYFTFVEPARRLNRKTTWRSSLRGLQCQLAIGRLEAVAVGHFHLG